MDYPFEVAATDRAVDVGIITIVPTEVDALFSALEISRDQYEPAEGPLEYWRASYFSTPSARSISIVVAIVGGEAGNTEAGIATAHFLRNWHPRLMCLVGIAAGVTGKARIGDVVIPSKVHDRTTKVYQDRRWLVRGQTYSRNELLDRMLKVRPLSPQAFRAAVEECAHDDLVQASAIAETKQLAANQFSLDLRILDGSIASDNVLIRDSRYFQPIIIGTDEKCRGGEMEAAGFVRACQKERSDFPWLVCRGISDFADATKDDSFQLLAAKSACAALKLFIESTLCIDILPPNPRATRSEGALETHFVREMNNAFTEERWQDVCAIGAVLSRPLWLAGRVTLRYNLGALVNQAAVLCDDVSRQARAMIDDLGWSAVELKRLVEGERYISEGIRLGQVCGDYYAVAKGYRHLASLNRQAGEFSAATVNLERARDAVEKIDKTCEKLEIRTSLLASTAKLQIASGNYPEGIDLLRHALKSFQETGDEEREVKLYAILEQCAQKVQGGSNGTPPPTDAQKAQ